MEDTLFRRLEEMRKKPPGELFELLERTLDVLRATKEALLEQRREIRSLATAVDSLRSRVDQLVLSRSEPTRHVEPEPEHLPPAEAEPEPEPESPPAANAEPEPEPVDDYRHEDEYAHEEAPEPAYEAAPEEAPLTETVFEEAVLEEAVLEETVLEETVLEEAVLEETVLEEAVLEEGAPEPAYEPAPEAVYEDAPADELVFEEAAPEPEPAEEAGEHVLMLSTATGYRLVTGEGAEPEPSVEIDGTVYLVGQRVRSPFPGDERPAFVAEPLPRSTDEY